MQQTSARKLEKDVSGWWGILLVALTYVYFLIFAQFAFLKRLQELGLADTHLKPIMGAMALGGVGLSLLAPRLDVLPSPRFRLRLALLVCAVAALLTRIPLQLLSSALVSFLIGSGLGLLTVTLVTHLRLVLGDRHPLMKVGLGTGIGYLCCNVPALFTASPQAQALVAAALCFCGMLVPFGEPAPAREEVILTNASAITHKSVKCVPFLAALAAFTALVWLDSTAFFIIQSTPALKAGTWEGSVHLWTNGFLHLAAALGSAWLLSRRGLRPVLSLAFAALAGACLLLLDPGRAIAASLLYPIGVSLYSVALVAYPALLAPASSTLEKGKQTGRNAGLAAGWLYAVAGWFGSAMGIGMGQNLGHVPPWFVLFAGVFVAAPLFAMRLRSMRREIALAVLVLAAALGLERSLGGRNVIGNLTPEQRGRQVYIAEGCIHCHSQYVRPNSADTLLWGPVQSIERLRQEQPPLIGNRRQGPDLSQVGNRRSPLWLKAHFFRPQDVSYGSIMPSYAYLFRDNRGDDLVAYLSSLHDSDGGRKLVAQQSWHLSPSNLVEAHSDDGERLFESDCATCHAANGAARRKWGGQFKRLPPEMTTGPFLHLPATDSPSERIDRLAHIVKFGIAGTDMPGHEYLPDRELASIGLRLSQAIASSNGIPTATNLGTFTSGDDK